jgi:anti-sigma B factor antagonist
MVTEADSHRSDGRPWASRNGLKVSVERGTGQRRLVVSMSGELDAFNAECLFDAVGVLELDGQRTVVLDLTGLTFCDAAGVSAVLQVNRFFGDRGRRMTVHGISGLPRRVFTLTGIDQVIEVE